MKVTLAEPRLAGSYDLASLERLHAAKLRDFRGLPCGGTGTL